jgi:hypothetical protein
MLIKYKLLINVINFSSKNLKIHMISKILIFVLFNVVITTNPFFEEDRGRQVCNEEDNDGLCEPSMLECWGEEEQGGRDKTCAHTRQKGRNFWRQILTKVAIVATVAVREEESGGGCCCCGKSSVIPESTTSLSFKSIFIAAYCSCAIGVADRRTLET